jgi:Periplasmic copper-binding protein (NosD)
MKRHISVLSLASLLLGISLSSAQASSNRLYVSITGSDAANCQAGTPCRYFARAISVALPGSEIDVLTPGNYGLVTITQALSIVNDSGGVVAITPLAGDGVQVSAGASETVYLRGLTIKYAGSGGAPASSGIDFLGGGSLQIVDCDIHDFPISSRGIFIRSSTPSNFTIANTIVFNNAIGIDISAAHPFSGVISKSIVTNNIYDGIWISGTGSLDILDSVVSGNHNGVDSIGSNDVFIKNSNISSNYSGISAGAGVNMRLFHSVIHANIGYGYSIGTLGGAIYSYGDNVIDGNGANSGTLTPASLQ